MNQYLLQSNYLEFVKQNIITKEHRHRVRLTRKPVKINNSAIVVPVEIIVLTTYKMSISLRIKFDNVVVDKLFYVNTNSSPASARNKFVNMISKIVEAHYHSTYTENELAEMHEAITGKKPIINSNHLFHQILCKNDNTSNN